MRTRAPANGMSAFGQAHLVVGLGMTMGRPRDPEEWCHLGGEGGGMTLWKCSQLEKSTDIAMVVRDAVCDRLTHGATTVDELLSDRRLM